MSDKNIRRLGISLFEIEWSSALDFLFRKTILLCVYIALDEIWAE
jgi:hypothetical protein